MSNFSQPNISSDTYKGMFKDKEATAGGILSALVIIVLFSTLAGLFGYFIGDRGFTRGRGLSSGRADSYSQDEISNKINAGAYDFNLYNQIIGNLKDKYVDQTKVDDLKLFQGSLKGLVDSIGDPATNYFSPEDYKEYLESFSGTFEGIGVRLEYQDELIMVAEVFPNSPAEKEGVKPGYLFSKIEGKDITKETMEEVISKVRGESGSKVTITFFDQSSNSEVEKTITRAPIEVESIRLIEKNKDTVVLEVSRFTEDSLEKWISAWDENVVKINQKGYKNVILDLRGNGGGFLEAAVYAASDFMEPNKLILTERSRETGDKQRVSLKGGQRLKDKKVVVLINGNTASASEILAGALKFNNNYKTLGTKTYGKGTVQNTFELPDGGAIKITTEYWILPDGKHLDNDNPIVPEIELKQDASLLKEGRDNIVEKALELLK